MKKVFLFVFTMISIFFMSSCSGLGDFKFKNWYDINSYSEFKLTGNLEKIQSNDYNTIYNVNRTTSFYVRVDKDKFDKAEVLLDQIYYNNQLVKFCGYRYKGKFILDDFNNIYFKDNNYFYVNKLTAYEYTKENIIETQYSVGQVCTVLDFNNYGLAFPVVLPLFRESINFYSNQNQNSYETRESFKSLLFDLYEGNTSNNNFNYAYNFYSKFTNNVSIDKDNMKIEIISEKIPVSTGVDYGSFPGEKGTVTTTLDYKNSTISINAKTNSTEKNITL